MPLDSLFSFRPISLLLPASQSFLNASFYLVYSSFWNLISFSLRQAGFRPRRYRPTLDQILFIFQSISDGFNKPRPGSRTILATIDSVWHPALFHELISAGLPPCFARWTQSFLSDRHACVVFQNHQSRSFRVRRGVPQGSVLGPVLFTNDLPACCCYLPDPFRGMGAWRKTMEPHLPASLPSSVSCSLYADHLAIWSSSPSIPISGKAAQGALFRLECWSEYWCLPLNPRKCEAYFFSVDPQQAKLLANLLLLNSSFRFNPTPTFLGITCDSALSFSRHVSSLKVKFLPRLKALRCISASSWGSSVFCINLFFGAFSFVLHPYGFLY